MNVWRWQTALSVRALSYRPLTLASESTPDGRPRLWPSRPQRRHFRWPLSAVPHWQWTFQRQRCVVVAAADAGATDASAGAHAGGGAVADGAAADRARLRNA